MKRLPPAWFLFLFTPLTAEYVSGSSPYLNPFVLLANLLLYGPGALLIRELRVRWRKGWRAVFILAVAYVVAEEGLMLNTLFDPTKNTTGRLLGVNWVWTAGMVIVHSLVSLFAPMLLSEAIYHEKANEAWVKPGTFYLLLAVFWADVFGFGRLFAPSHRPGISYYLAEAAVIGFGLRTPSTASGGSLLRRGPRPATGGCCSRIRKACASFWPRATSRSGAPPVMTSRMGSTRITVRRYRPT